MSLTNGFHLGGGYTAAGATGRQHAARRQDSSRAVVGLSGLDEAQQDQLLKSVAADLFIPMDDHLMPIDDNWVAATADTHQMPSPRGDDTLPPSLDLWSSANDDALFASLWSDNETDRSSAAEGQRAISFESSAPLNNPPLLTWGGALQPYTHASSSPSSSLHGQWLANPDGDRSKRTRNEDSEGNSVTIQSSNKRQRLVRSKAIEDTSVAVPLLGSYPRGRTALSSSSSASDENAVPQQDVGVARVSMSSHSSGHHVAQALESKAMLGAKTIMAMRAAHPGMTPMEASAAISKRMHEERLSLQEILAELQTL